LESVNHLIKNINRNDITYSTLLVIQGYGLPELQASTSSNVNIMNNPSIMAKRLFFSSCLHTMVRDFLFI